MKTNTIAAQQNHMPIKKFTEGLLNTDVILKVLKITAGQTILDAGCGSGYMSILFSEQVSPSGKVYALDPNPYYIKSLESQTKGTNIVTIEEDITTPTRLEQSSIDLLYISTVVHIFSETQMKGFIQEAKRLLKPDAILALVEIEKKETPFGPPLKSRYSPQELKNIISMVPEDTVQVGEHFYMQMFKNRSSECSK